MDANPFVIKFYFSLTIRTQQVEVNKMIYDSKFISTGAPQGCVSTSLYTNGCVSKTTHNYIVKFSDDTTILSLLYKDQDISSYSETEQFVERCDLTVNVKKSEEIIFDPMSRRSQCSIYSQCSHYTGVFIKIYCFLY